MGKKTLSERIAEQLTKKKETSGARNKAIFLSLKSDIEEAIKDGWSLKQIWQTLSDEGKITFTYETFRKYANNLIHERGQKTKKEIVGKQDLTPEKVVGKGGFAFDSQPNKKDLL